jgi:NADH dehydrogenase (ubiquinone) Fe-S protein 5
VPVLEDYYECLHHKKEVSVARPLGPVPRPRLTRDTIQAARVKALQTAYRKAETASARESAPSAGQIRNLGLLDKEEDTKKVLGA